MHCNHLSLAHSIITSLIEYSGSSRAFYSRSEHGSRDNRWSLAVLNKWRRRLHVEPFFNPGICMDVAHSNHQGGFILLHQSSLRESVQSASFFQPGGSVLHYLRH